MQSIKDELARLETQNPESKTALQYLLEEHAEINVPNEDGFTALMLAARNGHLETVRALMECDGIDVKKKNKCELQTSKFLILLAGGRFKFSERRARLLSVQRGIGLAGWLAVHATLRLAFICKHTHADSWRMSSPQSVRMRCITLQCTPTPRL